MRIQAKMNVQGAHVSGGGIMQVSMSEQQAEGAKTHPLSGNVTVPAEFARAAISRQITVTMEIEEDV